MKKIRLSCLFVVTLTASMASAQEITGAGLMTFAHSNGQAVQHAWIDVNTKPIGFSLYVFGWDKRQPELWLEGFTNRPWKSGKLTLTSGAFCASAQSMDQCGPALICELASDGWSLKVPTYLIIERRKRPNWFVPAARFQAPGRNGLRPGLEAFLSQQGRDWTFRAGPTIEWRVKKPVSVRFSYLVGAGARTGNELRTVVVFSF